MRMDRRGRRGDPGSSWRPCATSTVRPGDRFTTKSSSGLFGSVVTSSPAASRTPFRMMTSESLFGSVYGDCELFRITWSNVNVDSLTGTHEVCPPEQGVYAGTR